MHLETPAATFTIDNLEGIVLKGTLDLELIQEALNRFKHAQQTIQSTRLDILEFPYKNHHPRHASNDNVFMRFYRDKRQYEIKVFEFGLYNAKKLLKHYQLTMPAPENNYEMTLS